MLLVHNTIHQAQRCFHPRVLEFTFKTLGLFARGFLSQLQCARKVDKVAQGEASIMNTDTMTQAVLTQAKTDTQTHVQKHTCTSRF